MIKNKTCALMGDSIENRHVMIQFIFQPTRVTSSATLIENILVNSMAVSSSGGNITCSISDHFSQSSLLNI